MKRMPTGLTVDQKNAIATLTAIIREKPDGKFWQAVVEAEQVVGHGRKDWWSGCPKGVDGYYKSGVVKSALSLCYRLLVEAGLEPLDHGPMPKVIDIDHPVLTTVEAEYDRAMIHEGRTEREREYAYNEGGKWIGFMGGEDQRPDDWEFIPWWTDR